MKNRLCSRVEDNVVYLLWVGWQDKVILPPALHETQQQHNIIKINTSHCSAWDMQRGMVFQKNVSNFISNDLDFRMIEEFKLTAGGLQYILFIEPFDLRKWYHVASWL